jgi:hypothetical protein
MLFSKQTSEKFLLLEAELLESDHLSANSCNAAGIN